MFFDWGELIFLFFFHNLTRQPTQILFDFLLKGNTSKIHQNMDQQGCNNTVDQYVCIYQRKGGKV